MLRSSGKPVAVVDFGGGNVGSVINALRRVHKYVGTIDKPSDFLGQQLLILPGVGSFGGFMSRLA